MDILNIPCHTTCNRLPCLLIYTRHLLLLKWPTLLILRQMSSWTENLTFQATPWLLLSWQRQFKPWFQSQSQFQWLLLWFPLNLSTLNLALNTVLNIVNHPLLEKPSKRDHQQLRSLPKEDQDSRLDPSSQFPMILPTNCFLSQSELPLMENLIYRKVLISCFFVTKLCNANWHYFDVPNTRIMKVGHSPFTLGASMWGKPQLNYGKHVHHHPHSLPSPIGW